MEWFSLFSGIGGFDLPLIRKNQTIVRACEIDKYARKVYSTHFPNIIIEEDARNINTKELPNFQGLCAGFPCQPFSIAGQRKGFEDTRGTVFFEIARVAKEKKPRILLLENVRGLLSHDKGRTFEVILETLDELGYDAEWQVLNSKYFVPQNRERIFIIGHLREKPTPKIFPITEDYGFLQTKEGEERKIGERFWCEVSTIDARYGAIRDSGETYIIEPELKQIGNVDTKGHNSIWGRVYDPSGIAPSVTALGGGLGAKTGLHEIEGRVRKLTPLECERLQGFPDGWTDVGISDTQRYKCLGNAVTVPVVEFILERLLL